MEPRMSRMVTDRIRRADRFQDVANRLGDRQSTAFRKGETRRQQLWSFNQVLRLAPPNQGLS